MSASLLALPLELQHHCLLAGSARDAMSIAATCRNFHAATHVSEIWQAFAARLPTHVSDPAKEVPMHAATSGWQLQPLYALKVSTERHRLAFVLRLTVSRQQMASMANATCSCVSQKWPAHYD